MAKGQQKSNREKKKPKQDKKKTPAAASTSPFGAAEQRDKAAKGTGQKKK